MIVARYSYDQSEGRFSTYRVASVRRDALRFAAVRKATLTWARRCCRSCNCQLRGLIQRRFEVDSVIGGYGELANLRFRSGANVLLQQSIQRDALGRIVQVVDAAVDLSRGPAAWSGAPVHDVGPRPSRPILRFAIPPKKAKGGAVWRRPRSYEVDRPCEPGRSPLFPLHRHRSTLLGIELTGGSHRPDPNPGRRPRASRDRPHANRDRPHASRHRRSAWCERTRRSRPR